ncbi:hypothetical protein [Nocardia cyriacigeorgica]|nr:hypothetical protein [Nocardia cyriacigeorgica]
MSGTPASPRVDKAALVELAQRISALFDNAETPRLRRFLDQVL